MSQKIETRKCISRLRSSEVAKASEVLVGWRRSSDFVTLLHGTHGLRIPCLSLLACRLLAFVRSGHSLSVLQSRLSRLSTPLRFRLDNLQVFYHNH
eukprot:scaffold226178_cov30-Tisochrysis_lutea.AAC.3